MKINWCKIRQKLEKVKKETSDQDGGVSAYTVPPHTTKRRTETNLKTKIKPELTENLNV